MATATKIEKMVVTLLPLMLDAIVSSKDAEYPSSYLLPIPLYQSKCSIFQVKLRKHVFFLILLNFYDICYCIEVLWNFSGNT